MADLNVAIRLSATDSASPTINKVTREVAGIGTAAEKSSGAVGGLTSVLGKIGLATMGITAVVGAVSGLGKALVDPINAASDLSESMNKVDVVFGGSAKIVQDFAKTAASGLGQSTQQALEAAGTFGNLFVSMGLGQKDAANLSTAIVELGSDLASFNNIDPGEALEKLRSGLVGESEPLRTLGVNLNEAAVAAEAVRLGLAKDVKAVSDAAKVQARYSLILQQTRTAQGDFKRTSDGMANSLRIIRASFANLQTEIGNRFLPVVAPLISGFARELPRLLDRLGPVLDAVGGHVKTFADGLGRLVSTVRDQGLLPGLAQLGREVLPTLQSALASAGDLGASIAGTLRDQFARINWAQVWSGATGVASSIAAWLGAQWARIDWAGIWAQATGVGKGLVDSGLAIGASVTEWAAAPWAAVDWVPVWKAVRGVGDALERSLEPVTKPIERWLTASVRDVSWDTVWRDARTGPTARDTVATLFQHEDSKPVARAVGLWLGNAMMDGFDIVVGVMKTDGSVKLGAGVVAAVTQGIRNAGPASALVARYYGLDVGAAIVGGIVEAITNRLLPGIRNAIDSAMTGLAPTMRALTPPNPAAPPPPVQGGGSVPAFQHGGAFVVGGRGGPDSQLVMFRATPGEVVAVGHRRGAGSGTSLVVHNTFHVADRADAQYLGSILPDALARALEKARSQQGSPYAGGLLRFT